MKVEVVSASAGTGKTWRLSRDLVAALLEGSARPEGIVAITYTIRAAGELTGRIRGALLGEGRADLAARVRDGYLGTIHSVCQRLLREFALEAGLSPWLEPIPDSERRHLFDRSLAGVVAGRESLLNELARRLSMDDWKGALGEIVDRARENGMDAAAIRRSAAASREALARILPPVAVRADDYQRGFRDGLGRLLPALRAASRGSPGNGAARGRAAAGAQLAAELRTAGLPPWKDQVQFARAVDLNMLRPVAGRLVEVVRAHVESEGFQRDVLEMQQALFEVAALVLEAFAAEKAAARVVDFGDMLALAHRLLSRPAVQEALRGRLDLVLVDEFQDASPIQLAVVTALAALARRSIWVGDRKQAIFAFQGSDPDLMSAAVEWALQGRKPDILGKSYRSRPPLVDLCSELFARALAPHGFPEEQVRLVAAHPDPAPLSSQPALEVWRWAAEKREGDGAKAAESQAVAAGVAALLASPPLVRQRVEGGPDRLRPASRRDVAVLAFTNDRCRQVAAALRSRGIPAQVALQGLMAEPEAILARAALSLLADPSDGIAALEVSWLAGGGAVDPDAWLSRRMAEVATWRTEREAAEKAGGRGPPQPLPFADDPRVSALRAAGALHLSPAEALDLALRAAGIPELLRTWPEPGRRLANVEALRAEARAYQDLCASRGTAATVVGLARHLAAMGEEAKQAAPSAEDAVQVSTWHGAKGLEWPVVILSQLDHARGRSAFDVAVEPAEMFDFEAPLAGRWVRYWPWPYGRMSSSLDFLDAAGRSPEAVRAEERDRRERLRLLYVGFTRARDLLVAIAKVDGRAGPALAALAPLDDERGRARIELPFAGGSAAEVRVGRRRWACRLRSLSALPVDAPPPAREAVRWYAAGERVARPPERLSPSSEALPGLARVLAVERLGGRRQLSARPEEMGAVGDAVHGFLAADPGGDDGTRRAVAARLLRDCGAEGALDPATLLDVSDALRHWLDERYPGAAWHREWPVRARLPGHPPRLLVGEVDLCLDLPDCFVLVDHKSFPGGGQERDRKLVLEWAPQLGWYARVLADALGKPLRAAFVHLPIRGEMAEMGLA